MSESASTFSLGRAELESVDRFRRLRETAVLTIMFTDLVGFTELTEERGEQHANTVRRLHDEILESVITEGEAGVVVKHIGDAVMAVFSEPSTAVERALRIHDALARAGEAHPEVGPISVKIGLDMGQVTVEERIDADVFGRHVNRASRVEGMARGGQVLMTYPVFDSARGWLSTPANEHLTWASHGRYRLKGVSAPVEIFEVADPARSAVRPPAGGARVRGRPGTLAAVALVLLGVAGTLAWGRFRETELWLAQYAPPLSYLDGTELRLEGEPGDAERRVLLDVRPGVQDLHYDVADSVRYYALLVLERGENHLRPEWEESRLPTLYRYRTLGEEPVSATREATYFVYDTEADRIDYTTEVSLSVDVQPSAQAGAADATFSWRVVIDGGIVAEDTRRVTHAIEATDAWREELEVWSDPWHRYAVRLRAVRGSAHLDVLAAFRPVVTPE